MHRFAAAGAAFLSVALVSGAASAADLPARTYTKAPAMVAPVYDWSGFYIGLNGGGASSHDCLTITSVAGVAVVPNSEGCHNATGGLVGGQLGYRWQAANWVFGVEAPGRLGRLQGLEHEPDGHHSLTNQTKIDAVGLFTGQVGYAWNNVLWYVKGGAAVTDNKYTGFFTATGIAFNRPAKPAGAAPSARASKSALRRTGRLASNTITCSWALRASRSRRPPSRSRAPTASSRTSTWARSA